MAEKEVIRNNSAELEEPVGVASKHLAKNETNGATTDKAEDHGGAHECEQDHARCAHDMELAVGLIGVLRKVKGEELLERGVGLREKIKVVRTQRGEWWKRGVCTTKSGRTLFAARGPT